MRNDYRIECDSVYITVHRKKGEPFETIISLEDLQPLLDVDCSIYPCYSGKGGMYTDIYFVGEKRQIRFHRYLTNAPKEMVVDHINHNTFDNRRENLRIVTQSENTQNMGRVRSDNKAGIRGVHYDEKCKRWSAYAYLNGKRHELGTHETKEQAGYVVSQFRALNMEASPDHREIDNPVLPELRHDKGAINRSSGIKGISWNKRRNKWTVQLYFNGKLNHGGAYETLGEAVVGLEHFKQKLGYVG